MKDVMKTDSHITIDKKSYSLEQLITCIMWAVLNKFKM